MNNEKQFIKNNIYWNKLHLINHNGDIIDLLPSLILLEIYEDINIASLEAVLFLSDTMGILEFVPIIGGEKVIISFKTASSFEEINAEFYVYKVDKEKSIEDTTNYKVIRLHLISEMGFKNSQFLISKSYKNKKIHEIINDLINILNLNLKNKKLNIEETEKILEYFVIPFSHSLDNINYLKKNAHSNKENDGGFVFFETLKDINFVSLSSLLKKSEKIEYIQSWTDKHKAYIGNLIHDTLLWKSFDLKNDYENGNLGKTLYFFNFEKKYFEKYNSNIKNYINKTFNLGNYIYYFKDNLEKIELEKTNIYEIPSKKHLFEKLNNSIRFGLINNYKLLISGSGNSNLSTGNIIKIKYKSKSDKIIENKQLKGKWLITKLKHKLDTKEYANVIECVKDAFFEHANNLNENSQIFIQNKKNL